MIRSWLAGQWRRGPQAELARTMPQLRADACIHRQSPAADCTRCAEVCPTQAWRVEPGQGPLLDSTRCDGCRLCVAHCPQEALDMPSEALVVGTSGDAVALVACARAVSGGAGSVPCVHGLGLRWWTRLGSRGVTRVLVAGGACDGCSLAQSGRLEQTLDDVTRLMASRGLALPELITVSDREWLRQRRAFGVDAVFVPSRRRVFVQGAERFGAAAGRATAAPNADSGASASRLPSPAGAGLAAADPPGSALAEWTPRFDAEHCVVCKECVSACPSGALVNDPVSQRLRALPDRCTGCGLCVAGCRYAAINITYLGPAVAQAVDLVAARCPSCGGSDWRPMPSGGSRHPGGQPASPCPSCAAMPEDG